MSVVRSTYSDQHELLTALTALHVPGGIECDLTYGNGSFYKSLPPPRHRFDIDPQTDCTSQACSTAVPLPDASVGSVMFDPPFLTYVRAARGGNGGMIMAKRFSGYWRYDELLAHYSRSFSEASRILRRSGVLIVKCQDIVHNHRLHPTHIFAVDLCRNVGLRLKDLFVLTASHRLPSPNRAGVQKHARIFHSYFLVLERT